MNDRADVRRPFAHCDRNIRAEAIFVINVPDTAGDQRESGPDPKIVLFLIDHEIDGSHLPRLDPDVPKTAGHDRQDNIDRDAADVMGRCDFLLCFAALILEHVLTFLPKVCKVPKPGHSRQSMPTLRGGQ